MTQYGLNELGQSLDPQSYKGGNKQKYAQLSVKAGMDTLGLLGGLATMGVGARIGGEVGLMITNQGTNNTFEGLTNLGKDFLSTGTLPAPDVLKGNALKPKQSITNDLSSQVPQYAENGKKLKKNYLQFFKL